MIKEIIFTKHYLLVLLKESERICIVNKEDELFKAAEITLKKGFKKENELNQYQKELDQLQSANSDEPSIYKILKNCLKYADKIKPPEKVAQKLKEKEEKKKEKEKEEIKRKPSSTEVIPDTSLLNTLESMGFSHKLSRKALIECKNVSLESAIELIINKYSHEQVEEKTQSSSKKWSCQICTLINESTANFCSACEAPKPPQM